MRMTIVPFQSVGADVAQPVLQRLSAVLPWEFVLSAREPDPITGTDSTAVDAAEVCALLHRVHELNEITIGLTACDLTAPGFDYVFGYAIPEKRTGAVSLFRLSNNMGDTTEVEPLAVERTTKEILHEAGHLLGLGHCEDPRCVMRYSQTLHDTDIKSCHFCPHCLRELSRMPEPVTEE